MTIIIWVVAILVLLLIVFLGLDFTRFIVAKGVNDRLNGVKCNSGGILFVQGRKTYYQMPGGQRRTIANFPMDLTPGSKDMNEFTRIMEQAAKEKIVEDRQARFDAKANMSAIAKEVSK